MKFSEYIFRSIISKTFLRNIFKRTDPKHIALVSYNIKPLVFRGILRNIHRFSNDGITIEMLKALDSLGYAVDVVHTSNYDTFDKTKYDIFIGHANHNFASICRGLPKSCRIIYFSTGVYWKCQNSKESERLLNIAKRRGTILAGDRIARDEDEAIELADAILTIGNSYTADTYRHLEKKVYFLDNATYELDYEAHPKQPDTLNRFLFFAGAGNIHKGLDLLLEAFNIIDAELYICQKINRSFRRAFSAEFRSNNVNDCGFITMRSRTFRNIASKCAWAILPTASEGQPGSVLECMAHGLVPIIPIEAGIDFDDGTVKLPKCEVATIAKACNTAKNTPPEAYQTLSSNAIKLTRTKYSPQRFLENMTSNLKIITSE